MIKKNLRILVFCLGMEIQKPLKGIEHYKPDKIYMLCMTGSQLYLDFKAELERLMPPDVEYCAIETTVYDFKVALSELLKILKQERVEGNHVYVDITGPAGYSAAAMVAAMMEGAIPFFSGTKDYHVSDKHYYKKGKPIGISKTVREPYELPIFSLERPEDRLVKGLAIWHGLQAKGGLMTDTRIIKAFGEAGLMEDIIDSRDHVTQNAKMRYRRQFLDKWIEKGWMESIRRGKYNVTPDGVVAIGVF